MLMKLFNVVLNSKIFYIIIHKKFPGVFETEMMYFFCVSYFLQFMFNFNLVVYISVIPSLDFFN